MLSSIATNNTAASTRQIFKYLLNSNSSHRKVKIIAESFFAFIMSKKAHIMGYVNKVIIIKYMQ